MNRHDFTRMLIEGTVSRTMNQMKKDPQRSLRNLVDLGVTFSSGRFQRTFLELAQRMLENEQSAYYTLLDQAIHQVNPDTLRDFGINLGYESLTRGAETIRRIEAIGSYNIPWILSLDAGAEGLDPSALREILRQGVEQGIYTYALVGNDAELTAVQELTEQYPLCAFLLITAGENLLQQNLDQIAGCHNLWVSIQADEAGLEAAEALSAGGFLYGIHDFYLDGAAITTERLEHYLDYQPISVILVPGEEQAFSVSPEIHQQVKDLRMEQKYPYFLMEAVGDSLYIDQVISGDACMLFIRGNGDTVGVDRDGFQLAGNILDKPLVQLLRQAVPKAQMPQSGEV